MTVRHGIEYRLRGSGNEWSQMSILLPLEGAVNLKEHYESHYQPMIFRLFEVVVP